MNIYAYSYNLRTRRIGWTAGWLPRRADLRVLIERLVPQNAASVLSRPASGCPGAGRTGVRPAVRRAPDPGRSHIHRASLFCGRRCRRFGRLAGRSAGRAAGRADAIPGGCPALLRNGLCRGRSAGSAHPHACLRLRRGALRRRGAVLRLSGPDGRRHPLFPAAVYHRPPFVCCGQVRCQQSPGAPSHAGAILLSGAPCTPMLPAMRGRASLLAAPSAASGLHTLPARRASFSLPVPPGNMCPLSGRRDGNAQNPVRDRLFCPGRDFLTPSSPAAPSRRTPAPSDTPGPAPPLSGWCRRGGPSWRTPPPPRSRSSASGRSPASGSC